jgi:hypothetical protein
MSTTTEASASTAKNKPYGFSTLFYVPRSDRIGRKPAISP